MTSAGFCPHTACTLWPASHLSSLHCTSFRNNSSAVLHRNRPRASRGFLRVTADSSARPSLHRTESSQHGVWIRVACNAHSPSSIPRSVPQIAPAPPPCSLPRWPANRRYDDNISPPRPLSPYRRVCCFRSSTAQDCGGEDEDTICVAPLRCTDTLLLRRQFPVQLLLCEL